MPVVRPLQLVPLIVLAAASLAAAPGAHSAAQSNRVSLQRHLRRGMELEKIGFYSEAEAEFLAALADAEPPETPQITEALHRVREAHLRAEAAKVPEGSEKYFQLGSQLELQRHYDEALAAYQRALEAANTPQTQDRAKAAIARVVESKHSFWEQYNSDWLQSFYKVLLTLFGAWILFKILGFLGRKLARFSRRIEVADFADSTDTGFGKGFPALLRTLYDDRQELAQAGMTLRISGISPYRSPKIDLPLMGSATYEDFSYMKLQVAGVEMSDFLRKAGRLLRQPRYTVTGTIYRYGDEIRATTTLARYNGVLGRWNFALWNNQNGGPLPSDCAYEVIETIVRDCERHSRKTN